MVDSTMLNSRDPDTPPAADSSARTQGQCLEELASDDDIVARFTYSPGYIDAVAMQERDPNAENDPPSLAYSAGSRRGYEGPKATAGRFL